MRAFDDLRADALALLERVYELAVSGGAGNETIRRLLGSIARLESGLLWTAVVGEYKQGKSTLLSALLDEPGLFPAEALPATNAITTVRWGPAEKVTVSLQHADGSTEQVVIGRAEIADYVTERGNPGNQRKVLGVEIEAPIPKLASGLAFADLPGVGGVVREHEAVTLAFLPTADALLFVTDGEAPLHGSEIAFLERAVRAAHLTGDADSVVAVLTKIDQGTEWEELYESDRVLLAKLLGIDAEQVPFIPVSAWEKLEFLASGKETALANSNFAALEEALWAALGRRRVRVLTYGALREVSEASLGMLAPVQAAWQARQDETTDTLEDLEHQAANRRAELAELAANTKKWHQELDRELAAGQVRLEELARQELDRNWQRFLAQYLEDPHMLADPDRLKATVNADTAALAGVLLTLARREVAEAAERFSAAHGLSLTPYTVADLPDLPLPEVTVDLSALARPRKGGAWVQARGVTVGSGLGGSIGAVLGAVVGSVILPGPGTIVGAGIGSGIASAIGGVFGWKSARESVKARETESLQRELTQVFSSHRVAQERSLKTLVKLTMDDARPAAHEELDSRIQQRKEVTEAILRRLAQERRAFEAGQAAEEIRYLAEREPFDEALADAARLSHDVEDYATDSGTGGDTEADEGSKAVVDDGQPAAEDAA
jgi:hypothetical protein